MQERDDFDRLLVSFLMKELNADEEAFVKGKLNSDDDFLQSYLELECLFRLLNIKQNADAIDLVQERKHFEVLRLKRHQQAGPAIEANNVGELGEVRRSKVYKFFRAIAVAASVLFVIGLGWRLYTNNEVKNSSLQTISEHVENDKKQLTHNEVNLSGESRRFLLKDGTEVTLWNQSGVTFVDTFSSLGRDINLTGKAGFKVAKDKTRPFRVYTGDLTTTALGTEFIVTNIEKEKCIIVRLLEGKVVVKSVEGANIKLKKPIYLLPGQELLYDKKTAVVIVRNYRKNTSKTAIFGKSDEFHDDPFLPENSKGSWYMFNNQSLPQVFDHLEKLYGVEIEYERPDMQKLYFIGKFNITDSPEYILRNIAAINNLKLKKQKNKFFIYK